MFVLFVHHYGKTTVEDCKANCQQMAADWHPADGVDTLVLRLFTGAAFTGCTNFTMADHDIIDIGLCVIKWCGMYPKEYKAWIACEAIHPRIVKTFNSFKTFWAVKITLVNQTAIPASQYGYRMAATNNNNSIVSYGKSLVNFGATYAATQESVKLQGTTKAMSKITLTPCHSTALHYSSKQPRPTMQLSNNVAPTTIGVVWLDAKGMAEAEVAATVTAATAAAVAAAAAAAVAAAAAAAAVAVATNSRRIHSQEQRANIQITPPRCTSALKTETSATLTVAMLTTGTPAGCAPNRARAQSTRNKDQHDEWITHGSPQDNSTFGFQPHTPHPMPATSSCPCNLAATSNPRQLHHLYAADDAASTLPPNALHGAAVGTYASSGCQACSSRTRTTGGHDDDALVCTVPSASSLLMGRGDQQ
jgi:hypothetical protein